MPHVQNVRAIDRSEFINIKKTGFVVRKRTNIKQIYRMVLVAAIIVFGVSLLVYNDAMVGSMMCVVVGSITLSLGRKIEQQQKMLQTTEFMNALFASALGKKYKFCIVVGQDGEIVYLNRSFQEMFPDFLDQQPKRTLENLLIMRNVSVEHRQIILSLVTQGTESSITVSLDGADGNVPEPCTLFIEPIVRPSGFVMLRGQ